MRSGKRRCGKDNDASQPVRSYFTCVMCRAQHVFDFPAALEAAVEHAYPGRESALRNETWRQLTALLRYFHLEERA